MPGDRFQPRKAFAERLRLEALGAGSGNRTVAQGLRPVVHPSLRRAHLPLIRTDKIPQLIPRKGQESQEEAPEFVDDPPTPPPVSLVRFPIFIFDDGPSFAAPTHHAEPPPSRLAAVA
jgi:hypothetical protein